MTSSPSPSPSPPYSGAAVSPPTPPGGASASASASADEIAFFDVETTVPSRAGQGYCLLEFGAILVCPRRLVEVGCYSTLVRPADLSAISAASVRCNGITKDAVAVAPTFAEVADSVYNILHGRVWAGHNILRFDCARIREAFREIGREAPEPRGTIDSLPLLTQKFGRRAGNMKMATLAAYFGLGQQRHRSLDDVRMNLEVLKYCATVLFLESSVMELSCLNNWPSSSTPRIKSNTNVFPDLTMPDLDSSSSSSFNIRGRSLTSVTVSASNDLESDVDAKGLTSLLEQMNISSKQNEVHVDVRSTNDKPELLTAEVSCTSTGFINPGRVSESDISTSLLSANSHGCRMLLLNGEAPLQLCCMELKVLCGISTKFLDHAGKPKLSIALAAPTSLCQVLDVCERVARESLLKFGSSSEWRPLIKKYCFTSSPVVRLNIPTSAKDGASMCLAEIYQKELCGLVTKFDFSEFNSPKLESLFVPGTIIDAYFSVDIYDYQQYAGIRLVAKRLNVHSR